MFPKYDMAGTKYKLNNVLKYNQIKNCGKFTF